MSGIYGRCGNCMQPHSYHRQRMAAAPICQSGGTIYREATEEELEAGYKAAFPDGPKPIATFRADDPADVERAKQLLSPDALRKFTGPNGFDVSGFTAAIVASEQAKGGAECASCGFTDCGAECLG